ncbi:hypothetical protein D1007_62404 [Hordeum vulgare]|nr:hypothetical protein D1007_62404 [Hordeum vulgare]
MCGDGLAQEEDPTKIATRDSLSVEEPPDQASAGFHGRFLENLCDEPSRSGPVSLLAYPILIHLDRIHDFSIEPVEPPCRGSPGSSHSDASGIPSDDLGSPLATTRPNGTTGGTSILRTGPSLPDSKEGPCTRASTLAAATTRTAQEMLLLLDDWEAAPAHGRSLMALAPAMETAPAEAQDMAHMTIITDGSSIRWTMRALTA